MNYIHYDRNNLIVIENSCYFGVVFGNVFLIELRGKLYN